MAAPTGTHTISDLLAARFDSPKEYGLDTIAQVLNADIAAHNTIVTELVSDLADVTADAQRIYGSSMDGEMQKFDEAGRAPTQKSLPGATVAAPLELYQFATGWTYKFLETGKAADMAIKSRGAQKADLRNITREIKRAFYVPTNYTIRDYLVDDISLAVKRLVNADSAPIPDGPNGETYDGSSHTHYSANAGLVVANVIASIDTVVEHGHGNDVILVIARADEVAVKALVGFEPFVDSRLTMNTAANQPNQRRLDASRLDNRPIGLLGAATVWVKPWAIAGYTVCYDAGSSDKPLMFRQRANTSLQGLRIASQFDNYPLQAQHMEREFGVGCWTRTNGSVHDFVNASYTAPTIT